MNFPATDEERWKYLFTSISNLTESINVVRSEIHTSSKSVDSIYKQVKGFDNRMTQSERSLSALESLTRARNIIIFKLNDTDEINNDLSAIVLNIFKKVNLQIPELAIDDVFRLGKSQGNRPTMVQFISAKWVKLVFSRVRELRKENIIIANDRSKEERENRRLLLEQVRKMREDGQNAVLRGNKIVISEESFLRRTICPLHLTCPKLQPRVRENGPLTPPPPPLLQSPWIPKKLLRKRKDAPSLR